MHTFMTAVLVFCLVFVVSLVCGLPFWIYLITKWWENYLNNPTRGKYYIEVGDDGLFRIRKGFLFWKIRVGWGCFASVESAEQYLKKKVQNELDEIKKECKHKRRIKELSKQNKTIKIVKPE